MAIVKMKKLQVISAVSQREELLRELMLLGCVELKEQTPDPEAVLPMTCEFGDVTGARTERQTFSDALRILDRRVPCKTPMLAPKPALQRETLLDDSRREELLRKAETLIALEEKMKALDSAEAREQLTAESFRPWKDCGVALDYAGTKHVAAQLGTLPAGTDMDAFSAALTGASEATEALTLAADDHSRYLLVFYLRSEESAAQSVLRSFGFAPPAFGTASGFAEDHIAAAEAAIRNIGTERIETQARIAECGNEREAFRTAYDRAGTKVDRAEETGKLLSSEHLLILSAWAEADRETEIAGVLEALGCAYEFEDPEEEEFPEVPVKLKNNKLTEGLNMVTNMYSLPQYGTVDPNPLMAPFFILFYGIMMADMGYGLVMMLAGALIMRKKKPEEGFLRYFGELMLEGGAMTFLMGILTGGLFGDAPKWIVRLLNPASTWEGFPALIDPLNDTVTVLIGALILGFIHLNYGMAISFVIKLKKGETMDALCSEGAMWVLFAGAALTLLGIGGKIGLYVGLAAYVLGKVIPAKGVIGRIMAVFSGLYSDATGWFGDILSYARLMALMLAGAVIAQVFNTLGAMPGNIVVFLIVCLLGNTLNFGLNLLGCYVHDLRLQCLEFFNKFYVAGGRAFAPLKIRSKYYNVKN